MRELSRVTERFTESVIREMTRICDAADGINLSQGFPDFEAPMELKRAAIAAITSDLNQYPITFGETVLREAISRKVGAFNGIDCNPETDITVTCGATEAMMSVFRALVNPGDEFIVFEPYYENYGPDGILSGAEPRFVRLHAPEWGFDEGELDRAFNNRTKAIVINTPNNPTGKVFSREELEKIASLCIKWDAYAITDEIYEHIVYDNHQHRSIAAIPGMAERTITINSVSKTYSVTGWRVGWAIAAPRITARIRKVHDFLTVGAPTPFQHAAAVGLSLGEEYYEKLASRYREARVRLFAILSHAGFDPMMPSGAYYIMANIAALRKKLDAVDDTTFSRNLVSSFGVACVPGSSFYSDRRCGADYVRFAFCKRRETLDAVEERLRALRD